MPKEGLQKEVLPVEQRVSKVIDAWWTDNIHGSDVARSTEAYNHLHRSLADLKSRLVSEFQEV